MSDPKSFAAKVKGALESAAPVGTQFIVIYVLPGDDKFGLIANVSDDDTVFLLEESIASIQEQPPTPIEKEPEQLN